MNADQINGKTDEELEDVLLDLCGRLELDDKEVELLQAVEEERENRQRAWLGERDARRPETVQAEDSGCGSPALLIERNWT